MRLGARPETSALVVYKRDFNDKNTSSVMSAQVAVLRPMLSFSFGATQSQTERHPATASIYTTTDFSPALKRPRRDQASEHVAIDQTGNRPMNNKCPQTSQMGPADWRILFRNQCPGKPRATPKPKQPGRNTRANGSLRNIRVNSK
jgi:hypothetical protein